MKLLSVAEAFPLIGEARMDMDLEGWNSDHELFAKLVHQVKPEVIIEVGTWKGASACHMAELTRDLGTKIYCVDTWLGDPDPRFKYHINYEVGAAFRQFCFNVTKKGFADRIYPIPQTSAGAAPILMSHGIMAGLVYIDGDHSYEMCYQDMENYLPFVMDGGFLFGDDFRDYPAVKMAVSRFAFENNKIVGTSGPAWVLMDRNA